MKVNYCCNVMRVFLPDDLASKANIIIDPAEIQSASMDDLDEDEESGAAQVSVLLSQSQALLLLTLTQNISMSSEYF